ncbi:hypothetical protein [Sphingobacterium daejeonense]|uniref:hypothetical protein n=1 Tax=Sphingobacterium daejeonense TaxID=371142 RepID=UPI0010C4A5D4|nr:hypothetical protein [Sphingobacterium daejeonense]VTP87023.1 Uncharacterised protein [Sphingobacterium daejeonense]
MIRFLNLLGIFLAIGLSYAQAQYKQVIQNETVLLNNNRNIIPFTRLDARRIAVITSDSVKYAPFIQQLQRYAEVKNFGFEQYDEHTKYYNTIIVAGTVEELRPDHLAMVLQSAVNRKDVILCKFGNDINYVNIGLSAANLGRFASILTSPDLNEEAQANAAMSIFGGLALLLVLTRLHRHDCNIRKGNNQGLILGK